MNIFNEIKYKYNQLLKNNEIPLMQTRVKILSFGLTLLSTLAIVVLLILSSQPRPMTIMRVLVFLSTMLYAFYLLIYKGKWQYSAHIFLISLCVFTWSNILMYKNGVNLVTFQLMLIVISSSFYILGKNWGLLYSTGNVLPMIAYLIFSRLQNGLIYLTEMQENSNTFMITLIGNFILIVVMHYEFFKSFFQSHHKERELNIQLQSALIEAQEATRMRSDFLSAMSHELRTPLHAVIGMTNVLGLENPRKDQEENLAILRFSAENLLALINDTLDFSKMNAEKVMLNKVPFNLNLLLHNIYATFRARVEQKEIKLTVSVDFENDLPLIKGDQTRLTQILNNLISNAVKFTDCAGKIEVNITTIKRNAELIRLLFEVADTGIGIPENKQDIIFEPFLQANNNITKRYGGTGLGLAIVKKLIGLHGSKLKLQSEENKGSTFSFELDYDLEFKEERKIERPLPPSTPEVIDISMLNILIAEDNLVNIMVIKKILDQWKCKYAVAKNGLEAFEMVKSGGFDVVLMDIHMPVMDGFEAAKQIRNLPDIETANIKIIALTASSAVDIQQSFSYSYLDDYLTKPFNTNLLKLKLDMLVHKSGNELK